jgi:hypothetical protein
MTMRDSKSILPILTGIALLLLSLPLNSHLISIRNPKSPDTYTLQPSSPLPPAIAVTTVVLAGFRGIVADLLWIRAAALQEEGRYVELVQLANWITALEPHADDIWALQAWNMAYNVSVMVPDDAGRWRWVQNGLQLLRDRGLRNNPDSALLHGELSWLFFHKIGTDIDPSAQHYKQQWAKKVMSILGQEGRANYEQLEQDPVAQENLHKVGLTLQAMQTLDSQYGPLDWRVAETHALYWAHLGKQRAPKNKPSRTCDRLIYNSMAALFDHGRLTYSEAGDIFVTSPEFDILPNVLKAFEAATQETTDKVPNVAFASFLTTAISTLKFYHHPEAAKQLFDMLHTRYPSDVTKRGFDAFPRAAPPLPKIMSSRPEEFQ